MPKNSPVNSSLDEDVESAFQQLRMIGEKIEQLTQQINTQISHQHDKTKLVFLQKLKPRIDQLARLYQEELICIEVIKQGESQKENPTAQLPLPLFILEEKTWRNFGLVHPWAELKLQPQTLLYLAIENEIEHQQNVSENYKKNLLLQKKDYWKKELNLLGFSVQFKIKDKFNSEEFNHLLNIFLQAPQDTNFDFIPEKIEQQKEKVSKPLLDDKTAREDIDVIELVKSEDDVKEVDNFLQEMESFSQEPDNLTDIIIPHSFDKTTSCNIDLTHIDEEIAQTLNSPKEISSQNNSTPVAGYWKNFITTVLSTEETTADKDSQEISCSDSIETVKTTQQRISEIEHEVLDYIGKMDVVIKGSTRCDARLIEYLLIRTKSIAKLLIEKDFLLENTFSNYDKELEAFINANLSAEMTVLLTELIEPIRVSLIANIDRENEKIDLYNKKNKKNRPFKSFGKQEWLIFKKSLLEGALV